MTSRVNRASRIEASGRAWHGACRSPVVSLSRLTALLLVLTITTGVIDAVSVLGLGRVFTANMTGNIVFMGRPSDSCRRHITEMPLANVIPSNGRTVTGNARARAARAQSAAISKTPPMRLIQTPTVLRNRSRAGGQRQSPDAVASVGIFAGSRTRSLWDRYD